MKTTHIHLLTRLCFCFHDNPTSRLHISISWLGSALCFHDNPTSRLHISVSWLGHSPGFYQTTYLAYCRAGSQASGLGVRCSSRVDTWQQDRSPSWSVLPLKSQADQIQWANVNRLPDTGIGKAQVIRVSRCNESLQIEEKNRELKVVKYLGSVLTRDGYCTREIKTRIAIAKEAYNTKI